MKEDNLEKLFKELEGTFDIEAPKIGHHDRFLARLNVSSEQDAKAPKGVSRWKVFAIAASVALLFTLGINLYSGNTGSSTAAKVAEISPEVSQTEYYFVNIINEQVQQLESESTPETKKIVDDAMLQLKKLETNYKKLEQDLLNGGNSKLILSAMITNFQTRMDLLQEVLNQIETFKNLKDYTDENSII